MKKFITSIFLILSLVTTGLMGFTPTASAINKSAVRCDFLGQYINPTSTGAPCQPCPENNYCPLVSGTEIENCAAKGYPVTDCKETRKIFSTDKAIPCPAGTSTRGFTYNTLQGTRIINDGDLFPVGQGATDVSMCKSPDFKCSAPTPVLLKGVDGVAKCYPANTCNADQIAILKDGVPDCSVACKATIVNGKCYQNCPANQYLEVLNNNGTQTVNCKEITIINKPCPITGQIASNPADLSTCKCVSPQNLSADKSKCENPVIPCVPPQTGNQPNCVNPQVTPCAANEYGYNVPNCKPCPSNGTSPAGTIDSAGCKIPVIPCTPPQTGNQPNCTTPVIPCVPPQTGNQPNCVNPQITPCSANTYGLGTSSANPKGCTPCPTNTTSPAGTTISTGCIAPKTENNGGGFDWTWAAIGAGVLVGVDCLLTHLVCGNGQTSTAIPGVTTRPDGVKVKQTQYDIIKKSATNQGSCAASNESYINQVYSTPGSHKESNGNKFFWVDTKTTNGKTSYLSTIRSKEGSEVPALKCLMARFTTMNAGKEGFTLGSKNYMKELKSIGVLHGLNVDKKSPGYLKECIDLDRLASYLGTYGETEVNQSTSTQYAVAVRGSKSPVSPWFASISEVKNWINGNKVTSKNISNSYNNSGSFDISSDNFSNDNYFSFDSNDSTTDQAQDTTNDSNDLFDFSIGSLFTPVKASAQFGGFDIYEEGSLASYVSDSLKVENSELFDNGLVNGETIDIRSLISGSGETIEVVESYTDEEELSDETFDFFNNSSFDFGNLENSNPNDDNWLSAIGDFSGFTDGDIGFDWSLSDEGELNAFDSSFNTDFSDYQSFNTDYSSGYDTNSYSDSNNYSNDQDLNIFDSSFNTDFSDYQSFNTDYSSGYDTNSYSDSNNYSDDQASNYDFSDYLNS